MKKSIFAVFAAVVAMCALTFTSCSKEESHLGEMEEFLIKFEFNASGAVEDPQVAMALQMMKEEIESQEITYVGTLSEAKAKFDEAVTKGAELQTAINDFYKNFGVDIQVTLKMTNSKGETVSSHVWKRQ